MIEQTLAAGSLALILEAEDGFVRPLAANRNAADVERQRGLEIESAFAQLDDIARLGIDKRGLDSLAGIGPGINLGVGRARL